MAAEGIEMDSGYDFRMGVVCVVCVVTARFGVWYVFFPFLSQFTCGLQEIDTQQGFKHLVMVVSGKTQSISVENYLKLQMFRGLSTFFPIKSLPMDINGLCGCQFLSFTSFCEPATHKFMILSGAHVNCFFITFFC